LFSSPASAGLFYGGGNLFTRLKERINHKGSVMLEMIPSFLIFFAVVSFTVNFFIYSYSNTVLSMAAQEAGRGTVASFSTSVGKTQGERFISHYGVGSLIKSPSVSVTIKKVPGSGGKDRHSVIQATASGHVSYTYLGTLFFEKNGFTSKTATYYLEYTMQDK
jgi:Flp pilus assembly protein TadG